MKVLILTCNTGQGHNSACAAIQEVCAQRGIPCGTADTLSFLSEKVSDFVCRWFTRIYRYAPAIFDRGYGYAETHPGIFEDRHLLYKIFDSGAGKLLDLVEREGYDTLLSVHVFSALLISQMLSRKHRPVHTAFIATDYTCSPITGDTALDLYFIPHEDLKDEFSTNGLPKERLVPSGIPIRQDFYHCPSHQEAKAMLGLPDSHREILLMCGSMGCGPMEELAETMDRSMPEDTSLTVICGTNERLAESLEEKGLKHVRIIRYTNQMPLWLSAADLFLTKPGGLSITEAAAVGTPLLLFDAVGGCETRNRLFFESHSWAMSAASQEETVELCRSLLHQSQNRAALRAAFRRNSGEWIIDELLSLENGTLQKDLHEAPAGK